MYRSLLLLLLSILIAPAASAQPSVPSALEPWRGWALHGLDTLDCPQQADQSFELDAGLCAWPGELRIEAGADGAVFSIDWTLEAAGWVSLPGDAQHWPQSVRMNGQDLAVLEREGHPMTWLGAGRHRIDGRLPWSKRPETLAVPATVARIALSVDGRAVTVPERDGSFLRLGRAAATAPEADALELRVFRRVVDGLPLLLETRIQLYGAGQLREERLPQVLPAGFVPLQLDSDWPARLEPDGSLRVQVQADQNEVVLLARAAELPARIVRPQTTTPWPAQEIWSYAPDPGLRGSRASGPLEVDPRRADVPHDWLDLQAFALAPGEAIEIEERGRGEGVAGGNRLSLSRQLWLDYDGGGYSLRDQLSGELREGWRLEALPPLLLESARDGAGEPQLITQTAADGARGLEWRRAAVSLAAELRVDQRVTLPLAGWNQRFESVDVNLHLPPGYRLLHAPGAEPGSGDWLGRWRLLDVFLLAVLGLLAWHALGVAGSVVSVSLLLLGYHEAELPLLTIGAALGAGLLARALSSGRLGLFTRWLRRAVLLLLVLLALPFAIGQVRLALYPQLEIGRGASIGDAHLSAGMVLDQATPMSLPAPAPSAPGAAERYAPEDRARLEQISVTGSRIKRTDLFQGYSQNTVMQAGRALPQWSGGNLHSLRYPGPVTADEPLQLRILPPWALRGLRVLMVGLLGLLLWQLLGKPRLPQLRPRPASAATLLLPLLLVGGFSSPARAQPAAALPGPELLQALRERLTAAPECAPACARIARMDLRVDGESVWLDLEVHAQTRVALPLPQPQVEDAAVLAELRLDGQPLTDLLNVHGRWLARVPAGVHRLQLRLLPGGDRLRLALPLRPALIRLVDASGGWLLSGVDDEGVAQAGSVQLQRARSAAAADTVAAAAAQTFPNYVRVVRRLNLDTQWSLSGSLQRLAPVDGDIAVEIPLLVGERVGSPGLRVREGRVELVIADGEDSASWHSQLDRQHQLELIAPALDQQAEEWRIAVGPMWRAEFSGVPESIDPEAIGDDLHEFVFHPRPGERLQIKLSEPLTAPGASLALERVELRSVLGRRARDHHLQLVLRSTAGGEHRLALPADSELVSVSRDGETLRLSARDGALDLPLQPGTQTYDVQLRETVAIGLSSRGLTIDPGLPAANIHQSLELPAGHWVLWTSGPRQGPAVLYWGELAVLLLLALALSRLPHSPLRGWQWLLLALGFSAVSVYALLLVAAWLFAVTWRAQRDPAMLGRAFNLAQLGLLLLTGAALLALVTAVPLGLLGQPDMRIVGNGSSAWMLSWFSDRHEGPLPATQVLSLPIAVYRGLMLAWALWLAASLVGWLRLALAAWMHGGYWTPWRRGVIPPALPEAPTSADNGAPGAARFE
jgi:hypothetical protein